MSAVAVAFLEDGDPQIPDATIGRPMPSHHTSRQGTSPQSTAAIDASTPRLALLRMGDPALRLAAEMVTDLESVRIANENRVRTLTTPADREDADGICRGFGLTAADPSVIVATAIVEALAAQEHQAVLHLQRLMRKHPLGAWGKSRKGVGEKQLGRLLAVIGDPYWNTLHDRPRTVSQLWAYAGYHTLPASQERSDTHAGPAGGAQTGSDPSQCPVDTQSPPAQVAAKRRKGQRANWSAEAKTRAFLVAQKCVMTLGSPYRDVYLTRREHTATTHPEWPKGHSHNDGIRIAAKAILRDMWVAARDHHESEQSHDPR